MSDEAVVQKYADKGIVVTACYNTPGKVASVRLPFTPEEVGDLINSQGEFLPSCCADISRIRDIIIHACREDYYCDVEELWEAASLAEHHGFEKNDEPIGKLMKLWDEVKDDARQTRSIGDSGDPHNPYDALEQLYKCAGVITWNNVTSRLDEDGDFCKSVNNERAVATILGCVSILYHKLNLLSVGDVEGWGIFNGEEIGESRSGVAIYRTQEFAQKICDNWNKEEEIKYTIHKCKVSLLKGVEKIID